jgi:hypothetical protein
MDSFPFEKAKTREDEWEIFSFIVDCHIDAYTVEQYGDKGEDPATEMNKIEMLKQIEKYVIRNKDRKNTRGRIEELRDCLKIAHYACMLFHKMDANKEEIIKLIGNSRMAKGIIKP